MSDGLTLEKLEIADRLTKLETKFDIFIKATTENNEKLNHIIIGNGEKGIAEKVRNLEESEKKRKDYLNATWVAIIGLACKSIWDWMTGKPH